MYRGRGSAPSIDRGAGGKDNNSTISHHHPYIHYWSHYPYYIIHYDRKFMAMEIIIAALAFLFILATFVLIYKLPFVDPIEKVKRTYINSKLVSLIITIVLIGIACYTSKSKETLIKNLEIILLLSIIAIMVFMGIKINFDTIYNENKFAEFYETSEIKQDEKANKRQNISISKDGMSITDSKQTYINESMTAYKFFGYKSMAITVLYVFVIIFNMAMIVRLLKMKEKNDRLSKDDSILFDEEKNVKI